MWCRLEPFTLHILSALRMPLSGLGLILRSLNASYGFPVDLQARPRQPRLAIVLTQIPVFLRTLLQLLIAMELIGLSS